MFCAVYYLNTLLRASKKNAIVIPCILIFDRQLSIYKLTMHVCMLFCNIVAVVSMTLCIAIFGIVNKLH